MIICVDFRAWN